MSTTVDLAPRLRALLDDVRRHDSVFWRRAIHAGATYGPDAFVRYSPALFGLAFGLALPRHREAVRRNLRRALGARGAAEEWRDVAGVFMNFASCLTEAFVASSERRERLAGVCVDDENFIRAASAGAGVIVATAHTGGWHAAGPLLRCLHELDVVVVMQPERDARAQALQDDARDRLGVRVHRAGQDPLGILGLLAHLRRGGIVAVQFDRLPEGMRGLEVELFGAPFRVPEGPLRLAAASGAPIVPVFTRRLRFMEYEVRSAPPITVPRRPAPADLDEAARRIAHELERFVRSHPTQWFQFG